MWIEIPDDYMTSLKSIDSPLNVKALAINFLIDSMLKGYHIIYMSRRTIDDFIKFNYLSESNKYFLYWVKEKYVSIYSARDIITHKIVVSNEDKVCVKIEDDVTIYFVPLVFFETYKITKLITEHESDCEFFKDIFRYIQNEEMSGSLYTINFENDSAHGANVTSKLKNTAKDNNIALCIMDSDKNFINGRRGDTYGGANNVYKKIKNANIICLEPLVSREKENLFPPYVYIPFCPKNKKMLEVLNKFIEDERIIRFFDIKDGVRYSQHCDLRWNQYYASVIQELTSAGVYKLPPFEDEKFKCVDGIGDKITGVVCDLLFCPKCDLDDNFKKHNISSGDKSEIESLRSNFKNLMPQYMLDEWKLIYKWLFSWGCCIEKRKLSIYRL